ncbi:hypothetical protein LBMAG42_01410 [Deltaproteobacteria bacterium]|nr:hypothetical protein LBMAG42_01410 [Deltaproteobacteria bacterium]
MRTLQTLALVLPFVAAGCEQEAGFQDAKNSTTELTKGAMTVSTERVIIDNIDVQNTKSATFTVNSVGEDNLSIYDAQIVANPDGVLLFEEREEIDIPTGESQEWAVAATLPTAGMWEGAIRIESNDPTSPTLFITVCAVTKDYAEPCPTEAPDTGDTGGSDTGEDTGADTGDTGDTGV